jgi:hypothetical protein
MRRRLYLTPMALLSSACALRPFTPSVSVAYWAEETPATKAVNLPTAQEAIARWQLPPKSPWAPYQKLTLLSSLDIARREVELPDIERLEVVARARDAAAKLATRPLPQGTLWLVDLRGAASVAFGTTVNATAREATALVLTFNNWPAHEELVPAEETLAAVLSMEPKLPATDDLDGRGMLEHPIFLLDAWRLAYRFDEPEDGVTDNRYMITPSDLPTVQALKEYKISRVIYIVEDLDDAETEEDDLHSALASYERFGIPIHMVDLAWLSAAPSEAAEWEEALAKKILPIRARRTLVEDPMFYARARGGFGGIYGAPSPFRYRGVFRSGRHGGGWFGGLGGLGRGGFGRGGFSG